jgi:hypothetical protein
MTKTTCKLRHIKDYQINNFYDLKFTKKNPTHVWIDKWERPHQGYSILTITIVLENIGTKELFLLTYREQAKYYLGCNLTRKKYEKLNELYETDEDKFWETVDFMTFEY